MAAQDSDSSVLLKRVTPELYRRNAFRLTGLSVNATARDVSRQADKLKMLAKVGGQAAQQLSILECSEPPTIDEVREASQRLKDVEARAVDEFFWFWPEEWERPETDEAWQALGRMDLDAAFTMWFERETKHGWGVASHNLAVLYHMRALEWAHNDLRAPLSTIEKDNERELWKLAFTRWKWLMDNEAMWSAFKARIRQVDDAALTTGFARRLRNELPQAFDRINAELAMSYASKKRRGEAAWHVEFLKSAHNGNGKLATIFDGVLEPARQRLSNSIEAANKATSRNRKDGIEQAGRLLAAAVPLLGFFDLFLGENDKERGHNYDEVADAALSCALAGYNANLAGLKDVPTPAYAASPKQKLADALISVLERVRPLAVGADLQKSIFENLAIARSNHRFDTKVRPLLAALTTISEDEKTPPKSRIERVKTEIIPKLNTFLETKELDKDEADNLCNSVASVLRGLGVDAYNQQDQLSVALEAAELAAHYARDPVLVARLKQDLETLRAKGAPTGSAASERAVQNSSSKSNSGCVWTIIVGVGILIASNLSNKQSSYTPSVSTYKPPSYSNSSSTSKAGTTYQNTIAASPPGKFQPPKQIIPAPPPPTQIAPRTKTESIPVTNDIDWWHTWKNSEGREIKAKMVSFDGSNVILQTTDGVTYTYPLNKLSTESQALAQRLKHAKEYLNRPVGASTFSAPTSPSAPSVGSELYKTGNGRTYRISHLDSIRLSSQEVRIESAQRSLALKKNSLDALRATTTQLSTRIESARVYLNNTDQTAVDRFNAQVDEYNAKLQEVRAAQMNYNREVVSLNAEVDAFNADLARVGTLIR